MPVTDHEKGRKRGGAKSTLKCYTISNKLLPKVCGLIKNKMLVERSEQPQGGGEEKKKKKKWEKETGSVVDDNDCESICKMQCKTTCTSN